MTEKTLKRLRKIKYFFRLYPASRTRTYMLLDIICKKCQSNMYLENAGMILCSNENCNNSILSFIEFIPRGAKVIANVTLKPLIKDPPKRKPKRKNSKTTKTPRR